MTRQPHPGTIAFAPSFAAYRRGMRTIYAHLSPLFWPELSQWADACASARPSRIHARRILLHLCREVFDTVIRQRIHTVTMLAECHTEQRHWVTLRINTWYIRICLHHHAQTRRRSLLWTYQVYHELSTRGLDREGE